MATKVADIPERVGLALKEGYDYASMGCEEGEGMREEGY
jgi:hypothetical protein